MHLHSLWLGLLVMRFLFAGPSTVIDPRTTCIDIQSRIAEFTDHPTPIHPHSDVKPLPEEFSQVFKYLETKDRKLTAARDNFLTENDILRFSRGGMGYTFAARNKKTQQVKRYKAPLQNTGQDELLAELFTKEIALAEEAGKAGLAPKAKFNPEIGLLEMEEVEGWSLLDFQNQILSRMSESEKEIWQTNFLAAVAEQLDKLHRHGIVHLDVKPSNLMIPKNDPSGKSVVLIDFGFALRTNELAFKHAELNGDPYSGTPKYQGSLASAGKPGLIDDFDSIKKLAREMLSPEYLASRPNLRLYFALLDEPIFQSSPATPSEATLLKLAVSKNPKQSEQLFFNLGFAAAFKQRTSGQKLRILVSHPELLESPEFVYRFSNEELANLIDDGMRANGWRFHSDSEASTSRLKEFRERLGAIPSDLNGRRTLQPAIFPTMESALSSKYYNELD